MKLVVPIGLALGITVLSIACPGAALAHEPAHLGDPSCIPPTRPSDNVSAQLWQRFLDDVDRFRACTQQSMEQHQAEARNHQKAAKTAAAAWNDFVRDSLNAPEDFPHEPDKEPAASENPTERVLSGNWDGWNGKRRNF